MSDWGGEYIDTQSAVRRADCVVFFGGVPGERWPQIGYDVPLRHPDPQCAKAVT